MWSLSSLSTHQADHRQLHIYANMQIAAKSGLLYIVEVVLVESLVAYFPIALNISFVWPHRAPVPRPRCDHS
jgi:hypothetical protein